MVPNIPNNSSLSLIQLLGQGKNFLHMYGYSIWAVTLNGDDNLYFNDYAVPLFFFF